MWVKIAAVALAGLSAIRVYSGQVPSNDHFTNATILSGSSITFTGTLAGATVEDDDGGRYCGWNWWNLNAKGSRSVWYQWTPPQSPSGGWYASNLFLHLLQVSNTSRSNYVSIYRSTNHTSNLSMLDKSAQAMVCFPLVSSIYMPGGTCLADQTAQNVTFYVHVRGYTEASFVMKLEMAAGPFILEHPRSVTAASGTTALFKAWGWHLFVNGVSWQIRPLYQWWHDGAPLPEETSPILIITNVTPASAGDYWVVVRNNTSAGFLTPGWTTSGVAHLAVSETAAKPILAAGSRPSPNRLDLRVLGDAGRAYRIESTTNLGNWQPESLLEDSSMRLLFPPASWGDVAETNSHPTSVLIQTNLSTIAGVSMSAERKLFRAVTYQPAHEQCNANLKAIRHVKDIWAAEYYRVTADTPAEYDLRVYYKGWGQPRCPAGGFYTLGNMLEWPQCSARGHILEEPP